MDSEEMELFNAAVNFEQNLLNQPQRASTPVKTNHSMISVNQIQEDDITSRNLGEARTISGQLPQHRALLIEKQRQYERRNENKPPRQANKRRYNIPRKIREDPNFQNYTKILESKKDRNRNRFGQLICVFCKTSQFRASSALHRHYSEQHYDKCPAHWTKTYYECRACDQVFKRNEHYRTHCFSRRHAENTNNGSINILN